MELSERMMVERFELGDAQQDPSLRDRGGLATGILVVILAMIAGALLVATVQAIEGWAHLVVLGAFVATTVGLMVALSPARRA